MKVARTIYITTFDKERLEELLGVAKAFSYRDRDDLRRLKEELTRAKVVEPEKVPPTVVTMNSRVAIEVNDLAMEVTVTFPKEADVDEDRISVLSAIGTALLGFAVGDEIPFQTPAGPSTLKIVKMINQPEAEGQYHL